MNVAADGVCGRYHYECGSRWCLWREALCMNVAVAGVCGGRHCA